MSDPIDIPQSRAEPDDLNDPATASLAHSADTEDNMFEPITPSATPGYTSSSPGSPMLLSRNNSYLDSQSTQEDWDTPLDKLTFFDIFDNLALPTKLEKLQLTMKEQRQRFIARREKARNKAVSEWRKRVPTSEEQLAKYRTSVKKSVDGLSARWSEVATISAQEKVAFISAVLNVFISGYLIGAVPQYFYYWFTIQLLFFMPIRLVKYKKRGNHYFLADLCYFVNLLAILSIWCFPNSKRLFLSAYALAFGNNAVAIVMWRNSLVFHSLDKVTSLFIHVMPPVTLHCMVHLTPDSMLAARFPAVYTIKYSDPSAPEHYSLASMLLWPSIPYAIWQLFYHFFITVRRRDQILAGRPTSFTWLRKSYSKTWIGKAVISLPNALQEPAFMLIQYSYALLTILPCPIWLWYRWCSAGFLIIVFTWSVWNGANFYMDVFGTRFQKELEQMKKDVAKWQNSPATLAMEKDVGKMGMLTEPAMEVGEEEGQKKASVESSVSSEEKEEEADGQGKSTGADTLRQQQVNGTLSERKVA